MIIKSECLAPNPLVSVVICSYNREDTISQSIDSVLNQECHFDFEIIIGDDGSTDNTQGILLEYQKKYPNKIVLLFQDLNIGLGANWASTVKLARANYIAPIDDDDYWCYEFKLQMQFDFLESHPEYGLIHSNYYILHENSNTFILANPTIELDPENLMEQIFVGQYLINPGTACFKKRLLENYLDNYIHNKFPIQDWPSWLILSKNSKFMYSETPTLMYRKREGNLSCPDSYDKIVTKYAKEKVMYLFLCKLFPNDLPYNEIEYDLYVNGILLNLAYKNGDFKNAYIYSSKMMIQGSKSLKVRCSQNHMTFLTFMFFKYLRTLITSH